MSNSFDPDQVLCFAQPDVGPNCLQRLSAVDTGMESVKKYQCFQNDKKSVSSLMHQVREAVNTIYHVFRIV